jgi:outer membrane lipoprotein-sorting protein
MIFLRKFRQSVCAIALMLLLTLPAPAQQASLDELLARTSKQVSQFVDQFSSVKCTEHVTQEKLANNNKVERKAESAYDYLVILTNSGGELNLDESRLAVEDGKHSKKEKNQSTPLLISNGFATLFLIFHPYYTGSFQFTELGEEEVGGRKLVQVHFEHIRNTRSVAALAVRGREYPLDLSGTAWIEPQTGMLAKISAGIDQGVEDIGMKSLRSEVEFAPVRFSSGESSEWFPSRAVVEVETKRQHWRNTHIFSDYKQFSVSTEEQVAKQ